MSHINKNINKIKHSKQGWVNQKYGQNEFSGLINLKFMMEKGAWLTS